MQRVREMSTKTKQAAQSNKSVKSNNASKAPATVIAAPPAPSEQVAKSVKDKRAEFVSKAQNTGAFIVTGAGADVLGGRVGARTHAIHVVLLHAAQAGALITTKEITARATTELGAPCNATASHLNTMKERQLLTRENGAWRLTDAALKLCGAVWAQDTITDGAPAKANKKTSKKK